MLSVRRFRSFARAALVVLVASVATVGCGDDGAMTTPTFCLEFAPSAAAAADTVVARRNPDSTCNSLFLELVVTDLSDLQGAGFVVRYNPDVVVLSSVSTVGSVLESGGTSVATADDVRGPGEVEFALSRLGPNGVDVSGQGVLATLVFLRAATEDRSGSIRFPEGQLFDDAAPPQPIPNITWSGGTATVTSE